MLYGPLCERQRPAPELNACLVGRETVRLQQGPLCEGREEHVLLHREELERACLVGEDVLRKAGHTLVRELVEGEVKVLRTVKLGEELGQEEVKDLDLAVALAEQVV